LSKDLFDLCRILVEKKEIRPAKSKRDKNNKIDYHQPGQTILAIT
jgi:hypothetical protein